MSTGIVKNNDALVETKNSIVNLNNKASSEFSNVKKDLSSVKKVIQDFRKDEALKETDVKILSQVVNKTTENNKDAILALKQLSYQNKSCINEIVNKLTTIENAQKLGKVVVKQVLDPDLIVELKGIKQIKEEFKLDKDTSIILFLFNFLKSKFGEEDSTDTDTKKRFPGLGRKLNKK